MAFVDFLTKSLKRRQLRKRMKSNPWILPFLGKQSLKLRTQLYKIVSKNLPKGHKLMIIFKSQTTISHFLKFKDALPKRLMSHVIYKYTCDRCDSIYYGLTMRHLQNDGLSLWAYGDFTVHGEANCRSPRKS